MSKYSEAVKRWRERTKQRIIEAFGGECGICGYNKCDDALELHHLDMSQKEHSFGKLRSNIRGWDVIVEEARKCVLLCSICHREVHSSRCDTVVPLNIRRFDESYATYDKRREHWNECPVCQTLKPPTRKTCSRSCAAKLSRKVDWDSIDVVKLVEEIGNYTLIGEMFDVTGAAVKKRYDKVMKIRSGAAVAQGTVGAVG